MRKNRRRLEMVEEMITPVESSWKYSSSTMILKESDILTVASSDRCGKFSVDEYDDDDDDDINESCSSSIIIACIIGLLSRSYSNSGGNNNRWQILCETIKNQRIVLVQIASSCRCRIGTSCTLGILLLRS